MFSSKAWSSSVINMVWTGQFGSNVAYLKEPKLSISDETNIYLFISPIFMFIYIFSSKYSLLFPLVLINLCS